MAGLEQAFDDTEKAAEAARKSAASVVSQARAMAKAAQTGNIALIKRSQEKLEDAAKALQHEVGRAGSCWPFTDEEEQRLFEEDYAAQLTGAAADAGLDMHERDGLLISYPSIVRILAADRAVRVDRKKISTIRPSYLAALLRKNRDKTGGFAPNRFLEALYAVYSDIVRGDSPGLLGRDGGRVVPLARIYRLMTALPGIARDYDRSDFARDLYVLDSEGPHRTRNGAAVSFPSSTGTRQRKSDLFSFVGPEGDNVEYYGIRFSESGG